MATSIFEKQQVTSTTDSLFNQFWSIYSQSFPLSERRVIAQKPRLFKYEDYHLEVFLDKGVLVAFLAYWQQPKFTFIEHFAVAADFQNKGIGSVILSSFLQETTTPVVLEIEPITNEPSERRLHFYEKLGFKQTSHHHFQPPYHYGDDPLRMILLSYPQEINQELYAQFSTYQRSIVMESFRNEH